MSCRKYILTNTGSTTATFDYRKCDNNMFENQVELLPNQTKNIWLIDGTYNMPSYFINKVVLSDEGVFPPEVPTFTVTSDIFTYATTGNHTTSLPNDSGFTISNAGNYYGEPFGGGYGETTSQITDYWNLFDLTPGETYIFNVTWGPGSTPSSLAFVYYYYEGSTYNIQISPVNTSDPTWADANTNDGTALTGTFTYPATFSIYTPRTHKQNNWC